MDAPLHHSVRTCGVFVTFSSAFRTSPEPPNQISFYGKPAFYLVIVLY